MAAISRIWLAIAALSMASCTTLPDEAAHGLRLEGDLTPAEKDLLGERRPQLGLALSGGGLRSALYSQGVLRALYEKGVLQHADIISTVSGGGYTGYWLYTAQEALARAEPQARHPFGSARLGDPVFARSLCETIGNSNFVRFPWMIGSAVTGRAVSLYDRRIEQVYGDRDDRQLRFSDIGGLVRQGYPHLIVNATVLKPKPHGWQDGLYEFTAAGTRWGPRGEKVWAPGPGITYRRAVGISGAAFAPFLKQKVDEPPQNPTGTVTLYDGGGSENLGAIALIRRGVPTIVIVDAEHDPKYGFGAYVNLKNRLPKWDAEIALPEIDEFLKTHRDRESPSQSYFLGKASGRRTDGSSFTSDIHYIKMSMPAALRRRLTEEWGPMAEAGQEPSEFTAFKEAMERSWSEQDRTYDCDQLAGRKLELDTLFGYSVHSYGNWWNRRRRARWRGGFTAMNFPQYTTADQSMYVDQSPAFIGLGYLQGQQLDLQRVGASIR